MRITIQTNIENLQASRLEYTVDFINNHPFIQSKMTFEIVDEAHRDYVLKSEDGKSISIHSEHNLFLPKSYKELPRLAIVDYSTQDHKLIGVSTNNEKVSNEILDVPFDIFESIFFHISRIEETILPQENFIGRKQAFEEKLLVVKSGNEKVPIVDHLIRFLHDTFAARLLQQPTILALSHDIDVIKKFKHPLIIFKKIGGHFYNRKSFKGLSHLFKGFIDYLKKGKDPFDTFDWLLISDDTIEKQIYFLSGGNHFWDSPYDQTTSYFETIVKQARTKGYQLGIHPSYESWNRADLIEKEKKHLEEHIGEVVTNSRQHFLNFDILKTPQLLLEVGINKDSSLGFTRRVGFRCGTGFPYFLYDFERESKSELVEDPLVFMESSCFYEAGFDKGSISKVFSSFMEQNAFNTRIHFNFHNSFFDEAALRGIPLKEIYLELFSQ